VSAGTASRGFALAIAVFALALIAALLAGVFFAALQELRIGRNALGAERAFEAAEAGVATTIGIWDPARYNSLGPGRTAGLGGLLPLNSGSFTGAVTRLDETLFLVRATGTDAAGSGRRSVAQVVQLVPPAVASGAALSVSDQLELAGASLVSGEDESPEGWSCAPATASAGARVPDPSRVSTAGCSNASCLDGEPAVIADSTIGIPFTRPDEAAAWRSLVERAARTYPADAGSLSAIGPRGTATSCDSSAAENWGEPASPPVVRGCADYWPITYAAGDLRIEGGSGQGVLLVAGDLVIEGGFEFRGVLLVRGRLSILGPGGRISGSVRAASARLDPAGPGGRAEIRYSSCVVRAALLRNASVRPLTPRGWVELY
jgi:hypothetical protein